MYSNTGHAVPLTWLLLDSQSTVDMISNAKMLVNIRTLRGKDAIQVHFNSSVKIVNRVGDLPSYRTVWYKTTGIANILSMLRVTKKFRYFLTAKAETFQNGPPGQGSEVSVDSYCTALL